MGFRELIKKVQLNSGFSDAESKDALENLVESLAVRLTEGERKDFASQLPRELQGIAMAVYPTEENHREDMIKQFMRLQGLTEAHAKKQILAAWKALKEAISPGEIHDILSQLSKPTVSLLTRA